MLRKIKTFLDLPSPHKFIFIRFFLIVPTVRLGIKTIGFKSTYNFLKYFAKLDQIPEENSWLIIKRHKSFQYLFTREFPFLGNCLAQSMALWLMLKNKGIETDLRFGMKKEKQKLLAHAWLEYQGSPLATEGEQEKKYVFFNESVLTKLVK